MPFTYTVAANIMVKGTKEETKDQRQVAAISTNVQSNPDLTSEW